MEVRGSEKLRDKVRILVLGDSGVGKTSLLHLICQGSELRGARSTVGCEIHMKPHDSQRSGKCCLVEFWDIGASRRFEESRRVFYSCGADGLVLVHDLSNSVSRRNLDKWKAEWLSYYNSSTGSTTNPSTSNLYSVSLPPTLTIGNKLDLNPSSSSLSLEMESGDSECSASARKPKTANSSGASSAHQTLLLQVEAFIDKVMESKDKPHGTLGGGGTWGGGLSERRTASHVNSAPRLPSHDIY